MFNNNRLRKISLVPGIILALSIPVLAQKVDSAGSSLKEITVNGYLSRQPLLVTPASVAVLGQDQLQQLGAGSLLPAVNTLPGVRMEERSPGSYRLSIRGSLLRSPFGIRNVKFYLEEFPFTDAGGNTYLNLIDSRSIAHVEVLKGPDGSLFGANSGGVVTLGLQAPAADTPKLKVGLAGGSYGLVHENISFQKNTAKSRFQVRQAFQKAAGYRENSALRRHYLQVSEKWEYQENRRLNFLVFLSDLAYETPGGLTLAQFRANPRQARPAAGPNPGAREQQAGIYNQTLFSGISHEIRVSPQLRQVTALFGSTTGYRNPFLTNYEKREERNYGLRTFLEVQNTPAGLMAWNWQSGLELQHGQQKIRNFDNKAGKPGNAQSAVDFSPRQVFYFTRISVHPTPRLAAEAALSLNYLNFGLTLPGQTSFAGENKINFNPAWMPRVAISYQIKPLLVARASASRGYSPPTLAEIRPSNQVVNRDLQAENGWNYETGLRFSTSDNRLQLDGAVFHYALQQAIVRRLDDAGNEFFTNTGGTRQRGGEILVSWWLVSKRNATWIRGLMWNNSFSYSDFRFNRYTSGISDFSGKRLTGVPRHQSYSGINLYFPGNMFITANYFYTDKIPLNDANNVFTQPNHLLTGFINWKSGLGRKNGLNLRFGVDNILNQNYTLGPDLNAFGARYYNPAPDRNYQIGLEISIN